MEYCRLPDVRHHILTLLQGAPKTQEAVAAALHIKPDPTGGGQKILYFRNMHGEFQWHPLVQKVYYMRSTGRAAPDGSMIREGQIVGFNIITHGDAANAVLIWCRGFDEGRKPEVAKLHLIES